MAVIDRVAVVDIVTRSLRELIEQLGDTPPEITEDTVIVGKDAVVDSLGVVSLVVEIEQRLEGEYDLAVTLASEKAMSQRSSPFRTVGVLADYVCEVATAEAAAA
jgi:acyl carrier protein